MENITEESKAPKFIQHQPPRIDIADQRQQKPLTKLINQMWKLKPKNRRLTKPRQKKQRYY